MYRWLIFLHVLSVLTFFLAHGASASMALRIKQEKDLERIKALLDGSSTTLMIFFLSLLLVLITGIAAGFLGDWWRFGWVWLSMMLFVGITIWMGIYSRRSYSPLRKAIGMPYMDGFKPQPAVERASQEEIMQIVNRTNPILLAGISYGLTVVILWLMMFKPF